MADAKPKHPGPTLGPAGIEAFSPVIECVKHLEAREAVAVLVRAICFISFDEGYHSRRRGDEAPVLAEGWKDLHA